MASRAGDLTLYSLVRVLVVAVGVYWATWPFTGEAAPAEQVRAPVTAIAVDVGPVVETSATQVPRTEFVAAEPPEPFDCTTHAYTPPTASSIQQGELCIPAMLDPSSTVVVLVHGGGESGGDPADTNVWRDMYLDNGIATFTITYELAGGEPMWPRPENNLRAAIQYLRTGPEPAGIEHVVVHGFSSGARLAAVVLTTPDSDSAHPGLWPDTQAGVDGAILFYGYYDGATFSPDYLPTPAPPGANVLANVADRKAIPTPTLLVHGLGDVIVSDLQTQRLSAALVEAGSPVKTVLVPNQRGHGFDGYATSTLTEAGEALVPDVLGLIDRVAAGEPSLPDDVLLVGDSIAVELAPFLAAYLERHEIEFHSIANSGDAPCDLLAEVESYRRNNPAPDALVWLFTGNVGTPCTTEANQVGTLAYLGRYHTDTSAMFDLFPTATDVVMVEAFPSRSAEVDHYNDQLEQTLLGIEAVDESVSLDEMFVDSLGQYAVVLPCVLPGEPCPEVRVRAADGAHLGNAPDNLAGAKRFAHVLYRALRWGTAPNS